jgi:hypothetical protein
MAEVSQVVQKVELTALERAWCKAALKLQRKSIERSMQKEIAGSEIERLRGLELQQLDTLLARL